MSEPDPHPSKAPSSSRRLMRIQAISGLVFAAFVLLHLVNVMVSPFGPQLYDAFQVRIRPIYQNPVVELGVLLTALTVHIVVGVVRLRRRPRTKGWARLPLRTRLHRLSAYFLLLVIFGHITATRAPTLIDGIWIGFAGLSFSMEIMPFIFYPYYVLLGLCGLYHGGYGGYLALRSLGVGLPPVARLGRWATVPLGAAAVLIVLGVLSFGGWLYPIDDPWDSDFAHFFEQRLGFERPAR